jgi:uncharacterized spore protein YtfJ
MDDNEEKLPENGSEEDEGRDMDFFQEEDLEDEDLEEELDYFDDFDDYEMLADPVQRSLEITDTNLDKFLSVSSASAVYGEPIYHDDAVVIPAAEVLSGMGFGVGYGGTPETEDAGSQAGAGGGGGGYAFSRPVAVIIADGEGVRVEPVVDVTKIALAALTAMGFIFGTLARIARGR